jgi:hypothetical protein
MLTSLRNPMTSFEVADPRQLRRTRSRCLQESYTARDNGAHRSKDATRDQGHSRYAIRQGERRGRTGHRDLKVVTDNRRLLIELKASENAQLAIRDALGQLLEYAYFDPGKRKDEHALFIISRGASTAESQNYLDYIPSRFGLDVTYLQYKLGSNHLDLPEPSVSKEKPHAESVS